MCLDRIKGLDDNQGEGCSEPFLFFIKKYKRMNSLDTVSTIMTDELVTVSPNATLEKVHNLFGKFAFHHIPVVDEGMKLKGIISKQDLLRVVYKLARETTGKTYTKIKYQTILVEEIMTNDPIQLDPDDTIGLAADIFLANKFHSLPIVEGNELVGIVTTHDLLKSIFKTIPAERL